MALTPPKPSGEEQSCFKAIAENAPYPISVSDQSGKTWFWNSAFQDLFGDTPPDSLQDLFTDREDHRNLLKANQDGKNWSGEVEMLAGENTTISISLKAFPARNDQEQIIGQTCFYRDLTHRKQVGQELRDSETKYQTLVDSTPDLLYRADINGSITFISASVKDLSGYTVEEAIGLKMAFSPR